MNDRSVRHRRRRSNGRRLVDVTLTDTEENWMDFRIKAATEFRVVRNKFCLAVGAALEDVQLKLENGKLVRDKDSCVSLKLGSPAKLNVEYLRTCRERRIEISSSSEIPSEDDDTEEPPAKECKKCDSSGQVRADHERAKNKIKEQPNTNRENQELDVEQQQLTEDNNSSELDTDEQIDSYFVLPEYYIEKQANTAHESPELEAEEHLCVDHESTEVADKENQEFDAEQQRLFVDNESTTIDAEEQINTNRVQPKNNTEKQDDASYETPELDVEEQLSPDHGSVDAQIEEQKDGENPEFDIQEELSADNETPGERTNAGLELDTEEQNDGQLEFDRDSENSETEND